MNLSDYYNYIEYHEKIKFFLDLGFYETHTIVITKSMIGCNSSDQKETIKEKISNFI